MRLSLASTFRWLLLVAGTSGTAVCSCVSSSTDGCDPPREHSTERTVTTEKLTQALADGEITMTECVYDLCNFADWAAVDSCSVTLGSESPNSGATGATGVGGSAGGTGEREVSIRCHVEGIEYYCEGRRHASWAQREAPTGTDLAGRWLADAAANEAASVHSFRSLSRELRRCGIRSSLALRRAARQEIGHARLLGRLAKARGCERPTQSYVFGNARSLVEIALENAREGCVAETYAALVALHQAEAAGDQEFQRAFVTIAREEAEHAELAWALHAELREKLTPSERHRLDAALELAIDALEIREFDWTKGLAADAVPETIRRVAAELGIPAPGAACRLRRGLASALRERARCFVA